MITEKMRDTVVEFIQSHGIPFVDAFWCSKCCAWCTVEIPKKYSFWNSIKYKLGGIRDETLFIQCSVCGESIATVFEGTILKWICEK